MKKIDKAKKYTITSCGEIHTVAGRKLKPTLHKGGYLRVKLWCDDGVRRAFLVHRLVAMNYLPNPERKPEVNHINGIKSDNRKDNLEWCTRSENQRHAFDTGLNNNVGVNNGRSRLNPDLVLELYWKMYNGARNVDLRKEYGIPTSTLVNIKNKQCWQEVIEKLPDIPIQKKNEKLSEKKVNWICSELEKGVGPTEILEVCEGLTRDQVFGIKARRVYKHISKDYIW